MKYEALSKSSPDRAAQLAIENSSDFEFTKKKSIMQKASIRMSMFLFVPLLCSLPWAIMNANENLAISLGFSYFVSFTVSLEVHFHYKLKGTF